VTLLKNSTDPEVALLFAAVPEQVLAGAKGKPPLNIPLVAMATDVAPVKTPLTVTKRPILVYVPVELKAPTTVSPAP